MPLTNSLYVPGKLSDPEHVIVDVGTGYYVQKVRNKKVVFSTVSLTSCDADTTAGSQALPEQSGVHPHERRQPRGDDPEETGKHELLDRRAAAEDSGGNSGWALREILIAICISILRNERISSPSVCVIPRVSRSFLLY